MNKIYDLYLQLTLSQPSSSSTKIDPTILNLKDVRNEVNDFTPSDKEIRKESGQRRRRYVPSSLYNDSLNYWITDYETLLGKNLQTRITTHP